MTRKWMIILGIWLFAAQVCAEEPPVLKTQKDKLSYATGVDMVRSFRAAGGRGRPGSFFKRREGRFIGRSAPHER